jgi:hypothetical protein
MDENMNGSCCAPGRGAFAPAVTEPPVPAEESTPERAAAG